MGKIKAINISNLDGENTFYINQAILKKIRVLLMIDIMEILRIVTNR